MKPTESVFLWYAIYTAPKAEKKVAERLQEKHIEVYLPLRRELKQWSDRKKWVDEPVFRSYLFVRIEEKDYFNVLNTLGVVKYVSFGGKAAVIPDRQIDTLKRLMLENIDFEVAEAHIPRGSPIRVNAGPMIGLYGELVEYHNDSRVVIRIDYISQAILVNIPLAYIQPSEVSINIINP